MATDVSYQKPALLQSTQNGGQFILTGGETGYSQGSNTIYANSFVQLTSGYLASAITTSTGAVQSGSGFVACGFVRDGTPSDTELDPPYIMNLSSAGKGLHWPVRLEGVRFSIWVTDASFHIGAADGAPLLSEVSIGTSYGLIVGGSSTPSSGAHLGDFALDVDNTTNVAVKVVDIPLKWKGVDQSSVSTVSNGIVIVEFVPSKIQQV